MTESHLFLDRSLLNLSGLSVERITPPVLEEPSESPRRVRGVQGVSPLEYKLFTTGQARRNQHILMSTLDFRFSSFSTELALRVVSQSPCTYLPHYIVSHSKKPCNSQTIPNESRDHCVGMPPKPRYAFFAAHHCTYHQRLERRQYSQPSQSHP